MEVTVKVFRFNPETDKKPHYETYKVEAQPTDRVLDLLEHIKGYYAPMAFAAQTRCASMGAITWLVRR
jgi:succinate dehydrogenase/fumarate reductase-like Fe-S protein